jgi:hypothetical protein
MKIAAIALASALAAIAGSVQPGFAQSSNQNSDQTQYGQDQSRTQFDQTGSHMNESHPSMSGSMNDEEEDDENSYTTGQSSDNPQANTNRPDSSGWRNRMGPHGHRHMGRNQGASFSFRNGDARMRIRCPANEPLQTCVSAATQLLDKIGSLKNIRGSSQTSGQGISGSSDSENENDANPIILPGSSSGSRNAPSDNGAPTNGIDQQ